MASKEIALQQVQTGVFRDLPDALELGQIGFTTDAARLFIGLPSSTNPASIVAGRNWTNSPNTGKENIEIITEATPSAIINKLVNKPYKLTIRANSVKTTKVQGTSRLFVEYIAYSTAPGSTILESGSVQLVSNNDTVIISQQNNTNEEEGIVQLSFDSATYNSTTKQMQFGVTNISSEEFVLEFITRGWDSL